jgi:predicted DsbA family dithiol-disulfide isomerase
MSGGVDRVPYVLYSHRLLHFAEKQGGWRVQHDLQGLIFKAFYSDNIYLGPENLSRLAGQVGLDADAALLYLRSDKDEAEVKRQGLSWSGIGGVPYFHIDGRPAGSGCQKPSAYTSLIIAAAQKAVKTQ